MSESVSEIKTFYLEFELLTVNLPVKSTSKGFSRKSKLAKAPEIKLKNYNHVIVRNFNLICENLQKPHKKSSFRVNIPSVKTLIFLEN